MNNVHSFRRVENMQLDLIQEETSKLLERIQCPVEIRKNLEKVIVELVQEDLNTFSRYKSKSVYKTLAKKYCKSERTMQKKISEIFLNVNLYEKTTYETLNRLGLVVESAKPAEFIKSLVSMVKMEVERIKNKGNWIGW